MAVRTIEVDAVQVMEGHNFREVFEIEDLIESMAAVGLLHAISVVLDDEGTYWLNTGERRLRAARSLGWEFIEANVLEVDPAVAELVAIDENIIRRDLQGAALDKALHRRKELYLDQFPNTAPNVSGGVSTASDDVDMEPTKSFAEDTADKTGKSTRTIERSVRRADRLSPKTMTAYEDERINQTQADILAALPHEEQDKYLEDIVGRSVEDTRRVISGELLGGPETEEDQGPTPMQLLSELYMYGTKMGAILTQLREHDDLGAELIESVGNLAQSLEEEFALLTGAEPSGPGMDMGDDDDDDEFFPPEPPF